MTRRPFRHGRLKDFFASISDGTHFSPITIDDGKPYVTVRDIQDGRVDVSGAARIAECDFLRLDKEGCRPAKGDLLFSKDGTIGKVALCDRDDFVVLSSLAILKPRDDMEPRFLRYVLESPAVLSQVESQMAGAALRRITLDKIVELRAAVPHEIGAQRVIANFLDDKLARIESLISEKECLLATLETAREAYAFHLATGWLAEAAGTYARAEEWLDSVPSHWPTPKLGYFAEIGNGSTPRREVEEYWLNGTVPWITSTDVNSRVIRETAQFITPLGASESHLRLVRPGSAIVGLIGQGPTRGMAAQLLIPATLSQNVAYVSVNRPGVRDEYLVVALTGMFSALRFLSDGSGGAQGAMNCDTLRNFRLPVPSEREQVEIVEAFRKREVALEKLHVHAREHVERLREYRSSLISAAVTGQLDLDTHGAASVPELTSELVGS